MKHRGGVVLMADGDVNCQMIVQCALEEIGFKGILQTVRNGVELMDYLYQRGKYGCAVTPDLIILDVKMPMKDGRSALREIKADSSLRHIPVAVVTKSGSRRDIELCSRFIKCSYTRKPANYEEWVGVLGQILSADLPSWDLPDPALDEKVDSCNTVE